ncbi:MAG TPA: NYN domain-containing protein [Planctomycetaceae bacterium]|nr:NYN domain-containing protein [Planctomycetaceae bacterium]HIQ19728.1 NYN domain-containing protein [Planctomycetota bacterium]
MNQVIAVRPLRVLALVDEANLLGAARAFNKRLDWERIPAYLAAEQEGRELVEMVVYVGLPPAGMPEFQEQREKKLRFIHWLRCHGHMVMTKDGSPRETENGRRRFKANVDVLMAIDAMDLATHIRPDVVVLVSGDGDFAHLAFTLRRRGIRVEVAAMDQTLSNELRQAANGVIDLRQMLNQFDDLREDEMNRIGGDDVFDSIAL